MKSGPSRATITTVTTVGLWAVAAMGVGPWLTSVAEAKRGAPKEVTPVVDGGTRYAVDHFGGADRRQKGGYVQAWDVASHKMLWERLVYRVRYEPGLERDVQDVFITTLAVQHGQLLVENELGERFQMDLASGAVVALLKKPGRTELPDEPRTRR